MAIGRASDTNLASIASEAASQRLVCVYVESPTELAAEGLDLRLADERVVLTREPGGAHESGVRPARDADRLSLDPMLDRLAPWSRFARDHGFGLDAARRMYGAWLDRAFEQESVGVFDDDGAASGFVTVRHDSPAEIGLIASAIDGKGVGQALVAWAGERDPNSALRVATQASNERALALYQRTGFVRSSETYVYHLWLNDNGDDG